MRRLVLISFFFILQIGLYGCAPFREIGDKVGEDIGEMSDELGGERRIGEGDSAIVIHPQGDKKIKMEF